MLPGWGGPRLDQASSVQTAPNKSDLLVRPKYAEVVVKCSCRGDMLKDRR